MLWKNFEYAARKGWVGLCALPTPTSRIGGILTGRGHTGFGALRLQAQWIIDIAQIAVCLQKSCDFRVIEAASEIINVIFRIIKTVWGHVSFIYFVTESNMPPICSITNVFLVPE